MSDSADIIPQDNLNELFNNVDEMDRDYLRSSIKLVESFLYTLNRSRD